MLFAVSPKGDPLLTLIALVCLAIAGYLTTQAAREFISRRRRDRNRRALAQPAEFH